MDYDVLLNFLYKLIISKQIEEETKITKFYKQIPFDEKFVEKKKTNFKFVLVKVKLDNGEYLIIEDIPLNFFISYTILIGDETKLFRFKLKKDGTYCIADESVLEKLNEIIDERSVEKFDPKKLFKKKFEFEFDIPEISLSIKEYLSKSKKINFKTIHIVKGDRVENFLPTVKEGHFRLARDMNIPLVPMFKNNFIKESSINILDLNYQIEIIKPLLELDKEIIWDYQKNTSNRLYKDISTQIIIKINKEKLLEKLDKIKSNVNVKKLFDNLCKIDKIKITTDLKTQLLPIWKSHDTQKFLEIENVIDFEKISGRQFKLDHRFLKELYLQTPNGEEALFKKYYVKKEIEEILENMKKENKIHFKQYKELIIKLIFNDDIKEVIYVENLKNSHIRELKKIIKKLIKITTLKSIEFNKIPKEKRAETVLEKYFLSVANSLYMDFEDYNNKPIKKELIKNAITKTSNLLQVIKTQKINFESLYFYVQNILILIKILREFDFETSKKFEELFYSYYETNKFKILKSKNDPKLEKLINDITLANKLSNKHEVYIVKNKPINEELFFENIRIVSREKRKKIYMKPNMAVLKETFPYSFKEINKQILNISFDEWNKDKKVKVKNREIPLKKEYFTIYEKFENKKLISENEFFKVLILK